MKSINLSIRIKLERGISLQSTIYDWLKDGFTSIPNKIFNQFYSLDLTGDELLLLLYILSQINQGKLAEDINRTSNQLGWSSYKVTDLLNQLMNKGYLEIELVPNNEGKQSDHYTLRPFFEKLDQLNYYTEKKEKETEEENEKNILVSFEEEFGRPLTQIELETLNNWLYKDNYDEELVYLALKQAVLNQAYSLRYIDKILLNWTKKNIRTADEARREIERFDDKYHSNSNQQTFAEFDIPIDYWEKRKG